MLNKQSNKGIPGTYCDEKALPDTHPPVCAKHKGIKKKASEDKTFELMETDLAAYAARHKATTEKRFTSAGGEVPQFGSYTELYKL